MQYYFIRISIKIYIKWKVFGRLMNVNSTMAHVYNHIKLT